MAVLRGRLFSVEKAIYHMPKPAITPLLDPSGIRLTRLLRFGANCLASTSLSVFKANPDPRTRLDLR